MIFLSAQPDDFYFTWQLELQLFNFRKKEIPIKDVHVLVGYDPKIGLQPHFRELIDKNIENASFFIYPDTRKRNNYKPSIRPHIIKKHLIAHPYLEDESLFYHDADIIFRELPDFSKMLNDEIWYLSDTRDYTNSVYIKQNAGEITFDAMCNVIGIDSKTVSDNDNNCGGAQYLLKKTTSEFWNKIENDCEALFMLMEDHNNLQAELFFKKYRTPQRKFIGIQSWCADMWVVFWNALLWKKELRIHPELEFLIAKSPIEKWEKTKILHYSGEEINAPGPIFRKMNYIHFTPYYDQGLESVDFSKTASFYLVELIKEYRNKLNEQRIDLSDVTFLITVRIDSESRLSNLYMITAYLNKYFKTNILILESDSYPKIDHLQLPSCCSHIFKEDNNIFLHRTNLNNILIKRAQTKIIAFYDTDVIFSINQIIKSVAEIRSGNADMAFPYNGDFLGVSNLFKTMFTKILDPDLLTLNSDKFQVIARRSFGGAVFVDRKTYLSAGMDNEYFTSWGPEDSERPKRMKNLGYKVKRVLGHLYHLPHERKINSTYPDNSFYVKFMEEYLKIAAMGKQELQNYVNGWKWNNF